MSYPTTRGPRATPGDLDRAARNASVAVDAALDVIGVAMDAHTAGRRIHPDELLPIARIANEAIQRTYKALIALGAAEPDVPKPPPIPLEKLDTPDTRRLYALLMEAQEVAEQIDWERGRAMDERVKLLPGEARGIDLAETISTITLRLRTEIIGPAGRE
jgi:hypothetical protein